MTIGGEPEQTKEGNATTGEHRTRRNVEGSAPPEDEVEADR